MKKRLHIISECYPYGVGEQYFKNEILYLSTKFDSIVLYPLALKKTEPRKTPENVNVNLSLSSAQKTFSKLDLLKNFRVITAIFLIEIWKSDKRLFILKNAKLLAGYIISACMLGKKFKANISDDHENFYHSYWMNSGALMLAILKKKKVVDQFQFRVNGYDVFEDRHDGHYMPFRFFILKMVKQVFAVSNPALKHLKELNYCSEKIKLAYHGIHDYGSNPLNEKEPFHLVSCSQLIKIKRIDKIIDALKLIDLEIKWTHFGGGPLREDLELKAKGLPRNISYEFKGNQPNSKILDFYREVPTSLFIHTSETEGFGVAIVEAQCFGIPAIVLGVGGVIDIVSDASGIVLKDNASIAEIAEAIKIGLSEKINNPDFRRATKEITLQKFGAEQNYAKLFSLIVN